MSNSCEFDDSLGHAGGDADILNASKRIAHATLVILQQQVQYTKHFQMANDFAQPEMGMPMKKQVQHLLFLMMCLLTSMCL